MMTWLYLIGAGIFEMIGVSMINEWIQKRVVWPLFMIAAGFGASFFLLSLAMQTLPMGTAYAVWTGIGAAGSALFGMLWYKEPANTGRLISIAVILASVVGLKLIAP